MTALEAYLQQQQANQQTTLGNLQQAQALQGMQVNAHKQQQELALRERVAASGGDVEKALNAALSAGDVAAAHQLAPLVESQRKAKEQALLAGGDMNDPAFLRKIGIALKRPEFITHAERIEKQQADAETLAASQSRKVVQPDPQELAQAADLGAPAPVATPQDGLFAGLMNSEINTVAEHAKNLQERLNRAGPNALAYFQRQRDDLANKEASYLQARSMQQPKNPVAIVGGDNKPVYVNAADAVGRTPYNASIAGGGELSPEALRTIAEQYLAGDRQAISGYARNANARIAIQNEITKQAKEKGFSGADIAAQMADFAGVMSGSRTVGQRAANIQLAASEAEKMIDIVLQKSQEFERTQFIPINKAIKAFETNTGQPEVKAYGAAINSLVNVYARAISPSGVPTVSDKEHAREMLAAADSPAQVQAVMAVMRSEMKAAKESPDVVRGATRRAVTGRPAPEAEGWSDDKERRYQELLRKRGGS